MEAYFDNSATTRPCEAVRAAVNHGMTEAWYNPSALYKPAMNVQQEMDAARRECLHALHADGRRLIFTSCGTEADNIALLGHLRTVRKPGKVLILNIEHPAVLQCIPEILRLGHKVEEIPVDRNGIADLTALETMMDGSVVQISLMQVNNETGAVQPVRTVAEMRNRLCPEAAIHVDGVQGYLRVPFDFSHSGIQSYAFSGHKIHALKGTGGLICSEKLKLNPVIFGGGQEEGYRSGTENIPGILALGAAVKAYDPESNVNMRRLKLLLLDKLREAVPNLTVNGPDPADEQSAPHILNVTLRPVRSQTMLFALEGDGVFVSAGSACASRKQKISPVLKSMGLSTEEADCALRFSLCPYTTEDEVMWAATCVEKHYNLLKKYVRR